MKKTIIATVGVMEKDNLFYLEGHRAFYEDAHLVTSNAQNLDLGITHIGLRTVESDKIEAPVFRLTLKMIGGVTINGSIYRQKGVAGLRLSIPQERYEVNGETRYRTIVDIPTAVSAQVLRYASTWTRDIELEVEDHSQAQHNYPGMNTSQPAQQQQQQNYQQTDQQQNYQPAPQQNHQTTAPQTSQTTAQSGAQASWKNIMSQQTGGFIGQTLEQQGF